MASRNHIFISYSRKDRPVLEEFRQVLEPALRGASPPLPLEIWTDEEIVAGARLDRTIREAIEAARIGVLLVSAEALNSKWVTEVELPLLYQQRQRKLLDITWLAVGPTLIDQIALDVRELDGTPHEFRLSELHGLTGPDGLPESGHERKTALNRAVQQLLAMAQREPRWLRRPAYEAERQTLTVRISRDGDQLRSEFHGPDGATITQCEADAALARDARPSELFDLLLPEPCTEQVLGSLSAPAGGSHPTPLSLALRVRIDTEDPELLGLPWWETTWDGEPLRQLWTFELCSQGAGSPDASALRAPCPTLIVAAGPRDDLGALSHGHGVRSGLEEAWGAPNVAAPCATVAQAQSLVRHEQPVVAYVFARGRIRKGVAEVELGDSPSNATWVPLEELLDGCKARVVVLHLVGARPATIAALPQALYRAASVVLLLTPRKQDLAKNKTDAVEWLRAVLGAENCDPVEAVAHGLHRAAAIWTRYDQFRVDVQASARPIERRLARLMLDRHEQRGAFRKMFDGLVANREELVHAAIAWGSPGNHVELFGEHAEQALVDHALDIAPVRRVPVRLPPDIDLRAGDLGDALVAAMSHADGDHELRAALDAAAPRGQPDKPRILFLDWGCRGIDSWQQAERLVAAFRDFSRDTLTQERYRPHAVKVLTLLGLEGEPSLHDKMRVQLEDLAFDSRTKAFRLEVLRPLERVERTHILDAVIDLSGLPPADAREFASLLHQVTDGDFEKTVRWLEHAQRSNWYDVRDRLRGLPAEVPEP
ncbi:MAG: toll/interleukin-1 receptor domain-containing protein [Planctomycetota bacterium]